MSIIVRFMSLSGTFTTVKTEEFDTLKAATEAVKEHAASENFSQVKIVDEEYDDTIRFTATTPAGRAGRNVAFADF